MAEVKHTTRNYEGYLIINWRDGKMYLRKSPPSLLPYEVAVKFRLGISVPSLQIPVINMGTIEIPEVKVEATEFEPVEENPVEEN